MVKPVLKKPNLDSDVLANYRPISNLPFISKILETVVATQIKSFLEENQIMKIWFQSSCRKFHSTKTALIKMMSDLRVNSGENKVSILVLLDLSAAFDS